MGARTEGGIATIGITFHAQKELGDIVYVDLPKVGTQSSSKARPSDRPGQSGESGQRYLLAGAGRRDRKQPTAPRFSRKSERRSAQRGLALLKSRSSGPGRTQQSPLCSRLPSIRGNGIVLIAVLTEVRSGAPPDVGHHRRIQTRRLIFAPSQRSPLQTARSISHLVRVSMRLSITSERAPLKTPTATRIFWEPASITITVR